MSLEGSENGTLEEESGEVVGEGKRKTDNSKASVGRESEREEPRTT